MPEFIPLISLQEIQEKTREIGQKITQDYKDLDLVVIGVLNGIIYLSGRSCPADHH